MSTNHKDALTDEGMSPRAQGMMFEIKALMLLHRFGWLRAGEIGIHLYSHTERPRTHAERLMRRLLEMRQVFTRPLTLESGGKLAQAFLLSKAGADRLWQEYGIDAMSGKDINIAPTWRHDLLAHQVLAKWHQRGFEIITERELRRKTCSGKKIPDGLARKPGKPWIWFEFERGRKSGSAMARQAEYLAAAAQGFKWLGHEIGHAVVAYPKTPGVDHRLRNISALEKVDASSPFQIYFLPMEINPLNLVAEFGPAVAVTINPHSIIQDKEIDPGKATSKLVRGQVNLGFIGSADWWIENDEIVIETTDNNKHCTPIYGRPIQEALQAATADAIDQARRGWLT